MNYEIIKIVKDDENLLQYNQYGDTLKNQSNTKNDISLQESDINSKKQKSQEFEDDILYCFECDDECVGECTDHKSKWILNKRVICSYTTLRANNVFDDYYNENLNESECFCKANGVKHIKTTLPNGFFLVKSKIENTTYGIWTKNGIERGTILGPFLGKLTRDNMISGTSSNSIEDGVNDFVWSLIPTNNVGNWNLIDARDCMIANYLRFIRRARNNEEQNLIPFQFDGKIFYQALKEIGSNEELLVSYDVRKFQPQHSQDSISIREVSLIDQRHATKPKSESNKSTPPNVEGLKSDNMSCCLTNTDGNSEKSTPVERRSSSINYLEDIGPFIPKFRNYGFQPKADDEMKNFLKEIFLKYPLITGVQANKALRKSMPHKPILSDRTVLTIINKNGYRPIMGVDDVLDKDRAQTLLQMFKDNSKLSCREAKLKIEKLFPEKPPVTYETIDRILRSNILQNQPSPRRKIDSEMYDFLSKILKNDPYIKTRDLNISLQKAFPNRPKISTDYLNQIVSRRKLRPVQNARRKIDDEMRKYVYELYYGENFTCAEICHILNQKYPKTCISERCVSRVISSHRASFCSDNSD